MAGGATIDLEPETEREASTAVAVNRSTGTWGYRSYRAHLAERFPGQVIRKCCLQAGFTCPNLDGTRGRGGCAYCDNRAFAPGLTALAGADDLRRQWDRGTGYLRRRYGAVDGFIAYFQSFSNTYAPAEVLARLYDPLPEALPDCVGLSLGTRPDCLPQATVDYLARLAQRTFLTVELGLQSDRDAVLQRLNRGHTVAEFCAAIDRCAGRGFELCVHLILGLPGEGDDAPERLGDLLAGLPVASVKLHPLHLVHGTALEARARREGIPLPDAAAHAGAVARLIRHLRPDQAVQRVIADAPDHLLASDPWCQDKPAFLERLRSRLESA